MTGVFKPVILKYNGSTFTVEPSRVMGLIESIEDHVVMYDLVNPQELKNSRIARAYHSALVYAGAEVELEEVYDSLFNGGRDSVIERINGLLSMMIPPERLRKGNIKKKIQSSIRHYAWLGLLMLAASVLGGAIVKVFGI